MCIIEISGECISLKLLIFYAEKMSKLDVNSLSEEDSEKLRHEREIRLVESYERIRTEGLGIEKRLKEKEPSVSLLNKACTILTNKGSAS